MSSPVSTGPPGRLDALESIRGLAALCVVFSHLAWTFWPQAQLSRSTASPVLAILTQSPLRIVYDGNFAVRIFFVLSGVVLSVAYFQTANSESLRAAAVRRYFRLTPPICVSVLLAYLLLLSGAYANQAVAGLLHGEQGFWLRAWYAFAPSLTAAFQEGTYRVYFGFSSAQTYDPVLWTMSVELFGSFFVFAFLALAGQLRHRWAIYLVVGTVLHSHWRVYLDFLIGIAASDAFVHRERVKRQGGWSPVCGTVLLLTGLCLASLQPGWLTGRAAEWVGKGKADLQTLAAVLVIATGLCCPWWARVLEQRTLVGLGGLSFALYLLHLPIICSLGCRLFLWLHGGRHWPVTLAAVHASGAVLVASFGAAWLMHRWVDRPAIHLGKWVYEFFRPSGLEQPAKFPRIVSLSSPAATSASRSWPRTRPA